MFILIQQYKFEISSIKIQKLKKHKFPRNFKWHKVLKTDNQINDVEKSRIFSQIIFKV